MDSKASSRDLIRQEMLRKRLAMPSKERQEAHRLIYDSILKHWNPDWKTILIYANQENEVATIPLIQELIRRGTKVCIPSFDRSTKKYIPSWIQDFEKETESGQFGILEPKASTKRPTPFSELNAVFVPGLAFDRHGNRLGYGHGFFDAICREITGTKIGLAYHFQIVDRLEIHAGDVPMNQIITEKDFISCRSS